ncbi:peptidoglycan D,D-transpeptidase FtsI family protein [Lysinimonas soli]|uniref:Peptidoglycan D,D-transpeptidase FtsI family protein n=1 Tax=Lysinimonas soli TaxID=1074233 RepID=A0ABW0NQK3_9MICO
MHTFRVSRRRLALTLFAVFAIVTVFGVRLVDIQLVQADELTKQAQDRQVRTVTTYGTRGNIVDSNGVVLADSVDRFDITASPKSASPDGYDHRNADGTKTHVSLADAISRIAQVTGAAPQTLYSALTAKPDSDFAYLVKGVKLDVFNKVKALKIPWVYSEPHPARTYPNGAVAGNLVGFVGTDGPQAGTELKQNACLAGTNGSSSYETSADGVRLPGSTVVTKAAKDGGTITLTIDSNLQWFAQQTLAQQAQATGAQWGTAMIVRVSDGHIMAAADYPSVDPNDRNSVSPDSLGARSFTSPYEPGSIMKPATVAGLVDKGLVTASTPVVVPSRFTDGLPKGSYIKDAFAHPTEHWTVAGVIMNSSNIGIAELTKLESEKDRYANLRAFGLGSKTAADFLGEDPGDLIPPDKVDSITTVTQQFGQGMTATSAQIASLYQTLGNDGLRLPLTLIDSCTAADGTVTHPTSGTPTRAVSASAAQEVRQMMETVTTMGSLRNIINIPGYRIASKSGTAQVADANGRYGSDYIVSVAGLVPADRPQYAVIVTLAKPATIKTSAAAAPAYATLMKQVIKTYRITPSTTPAPNVPVVW